MVTSCATSMTTKAKQVCSVCERQFEEFAEDFDEHLASYARDYASGRVRDTAAKRVRDIAEVFEEFNENKRGRRCSAWYLAVAIERLVALEECGIPTQLGAKQ